jgi:hypothetical protein
MNTRPLSPAWVLVEYMWENEIMYGVTLDAEIAREWAQGKPINKGYLRDAERTDLLVRA